MIKSVGRASMVVLLAGGGPEDSSCPKSCKTADILSKQSGIDTISAPNQTKFPSFAKSQSNWFTHLRKKSAFIA